MLGGSIKMVGRLQGTVGQSEMCLDLNHRGEKCSTPKKQEKQPSPQEQGLSAQKLQLSVLNEKSKNA